MFTASKNKTHAVLIRWILWGLRDDANHLPSNYDKYTDACSMRQGALREHKRKNSPPSCATPQHIRTKQGPLGRHLTSCQPLVSLAHASGGTSCPSACHTWNP